MYDATVTLTKCTVRGNKAGGRPGMHAQGDGIGGGIYVGAAGTLRLIDCDILGNTASKGKGGGPGAASGTRELTPAPTPNQSSPLAPAGAAAA